MTTADNIILTMSSVSPLMAAFLLGLSPIRIAGTATLSSIVLFSVFAVSNSLVLAELAGTYPLSGGLFSFIQMTLPPVFSRISACIIFLQSVVVIASIALGAADYILILFPFLPQSRMASVMIAAAVLMVCGFVCTRNLASGTATTKILFAVQMGILITYIVSCLCYTRRGIRETVLYPLYFRGEITAADFGVILAGITPLFCVINGYDASLGLAEETMGESREISKSVIISLLCAVILIGLGIGSSILAAPDLNSYLSDKSPFLYTAQAVMGNTGKLFINTGILTASCGALISQITYYSRVMFSTARDRIWPELLSRQMVKISKRECMPYAATIMITVCTFIVVMTASMEKLVEFVGVLIAFVYLMISLGSIKNRITKPEGYRPFAMPLFPIPAFITAAYCSFVILIQRPFIKVMLAIAIAGGIVLYLFTYKKNN
ncbi:APC family permease [Clostridium sp. AM58-1XD]|uniref:APC family permease n=1 Tax=Clostridium sp. AM58-1XD TaxID=2292307 RepID=UPI0015F71776|nr:APC family permease [Clostridium sp. AM58-1XD]